MENEANAAKFQSMLDARGISRRSFMKLCGTIVAAAGVSQLTVPQVAQALEDSVIGAKEGDLYPVVWMEGASCTGCTEAFAQIDNPDPATVVLEMISLNYCETLSAAAGYSMEEAKKQTVESGNPFLLVYEGALLQNGDGNYLRVAMETGLEQFEYVAGNKNCTAVVALGSCATNGGWMGAYPAPANPIGCQKYLKQKGISTPVVNIPGCPPNPEWLVAVLVDVVMVKVMPKLNSENKPALIFDQTIHDNCQRRGHFENGEFVYHFGDPEEAKGYCLYALGCRGPQTNANCGVVRYNHRRSWCVESGAPCIGCCEANPMDSGDNWVEVNTPFYVRHRDLRQGGWVAQPGTIAWIVTGVIAAIMVVHGFGMKAKGRFGFVETEKVREWDAKHPNESIGVYDDIDRKKAVEDNEKGGE